MAGWCDLQRGGAYLGAVGVDRCADRSGRDRDAAGLALGEAARWKLPAMEQDAYAYPTRVRILTTISPD